MSSTPTGTKCARCGWDSRAEEPAISDCPCHTKGDAYQGYVYRYTDDRDILHEDWVTCGCETARRE